MTKEGKLEIMGSGAKFVRTLPDVQRLRQATAAAAGESRG